MKDTITKQDLISLISDTEYFSTGKTTIAVLTLRSGFEVVGISSVVNRSNFDKEIGKKVAYDNAVTNLWELEGYLLQNKLANKD